MCREKLPKQSDTHFRSIWPRGVRSSTEFLTIVHSIEGLHIMRKMDSHVCTNRLRIHLESVHPRMKFGNDF